ncbi:MAG TPA: peptidoglycan editing factor PgeF [Ktedonobacteraceae bacterium]
MVEQQASNVCHLQFNHYRQFSDLIHGVFTRIGGYSKIPYQGLNTLTAKDGGEGDSIENVIGNRMLALQALGLAKAPAVTLTAEHCANVIVFDPRDEWYTDWASYEYEERRISSPSALGTADALITQQRGTGLILAFADCVPILLYDPTRQVIGIAHGGWRGTARGIVIATIEAMAEQFGCEPQHIYAGLGPAIGACCYEVSETVRQIFQGELSFDDQPTPERYQNMVRESAVFSTQVLPDKNSLRLDLQETNRNQLMMAKVPAEQIEVMRICTSCNTDRFFSHRRENGKTGRFPVIIALAAN